MIQRVLFWLMVCGIIMMIKSPSMSIMCVIFRLRMTGCGGTAAAAV